MRLLNVNTLEFGEFIGNRIPPYAILSHVWSDSEVSYQDFLAGRGKDGYGYKKILEFCRLVWEGFPIGPALDEDCHYEIVKEQHPKDFDALQRARANYSCSAVRTTYDQICLRVSDGERICLEWAWIDTCCIDKSSSAELSEAINSMFQWYQASVVCLIFLPDVHTVSDADAAARSLDKQLLASKWFKRGWTLQELLAPRNLMFYNSSFAFVGPSHKWAGRDSIIQLSVDGIIGNGDIQPLHETITTASGIDLRVIQGWERPSAHCIARRMSWASERETTRAEDMAYCLLGLFDVQMPLLYGEGGSNAFLRLQRQILAKSTDLSLLVWTSKEWSNNFSGRPWPTGSLLAQRPSDFYYFKRCTKIGVIHQHGLRCSPVSMSSRGGELELSPSRMYRISKKDTYVLFPLYHALDSSDRHLYLLFSVGRYEGTHTDMARHATPVCIANLCARQLREFHTRILCDSLRGVGLYADEIHRIVRGDEPTSTFLHKSAANLRQFTNWFRPRQTVRLYF